jgi:hypothetical protein
MEDALAALCKFDALWQVHVVVINSVDLFVQVFYHISVGVVKVLNTFERTIITETVVLVFISIKIMNAFQLVSIIIKI